MFVYSSQKNVVQNLDAITPDQEETLSGEARLCSGKMKKTHKIAAKEL